MQCADLGVVATVTVIGIQKQAYRFTKSAKLDISIDIMRIFGTNFFIHRRRRSAQSLREARDLIERFMNDCPSYDFEWDDFISWKNDNPNIESVRNRLDIVESLLLSKDEIDRQRAMSIIKEQISYIDALISNNKLR